MSDAFEQMTSKPVAGAARSMQDITLAELMQFAPTPERPDWMITRFPVPIEVYRALELQARQPDMALSASPEAPDPEVTVDSPSDASAVVQEAAEGESLPELNAAQPQPAAPSLGASFDGIPPTGWQPPDNTTAVGPSNVLVAVNTDLAGYSKAGALQFRWPNMTTLFNPVLPAGASLFDPRVAYDHYAGRWIVVIAARRNSPAGSWLMIAVSQSGNPAGAYWVWAIDAALNGSTSTSNWADYPMLGFDTQAIYVAMNMFQIGGNFQYVKLRTLSKAELYAGGQGPNHTIRWHDAWNLKNADGTVAFTVQPAVHFRGSGGNPNAYLVNSFWPSGNQLTLWTLANPLAWTTGGTPALTRVAVNCRTYDLPPDALQSGSPTRVDTGDVRLLNAVYQNAGGVQRLWTAHTTRFTWSGDAEARSAVQWYEINIPTSAVVQQGVFGSGNSYYSYPAIQTDAARNAFVVFTRSSASLFAEMRQTGRKVSDAANSLQNSALVQAGRSAYTGGRWGDYFGICRDGGDSAVVWMYGEYAGNGNTWATRVCSVRF